MGRRNRNRQQHQQEHEFVPSISFKARTRRQAQLMSCIKENTLTFALGMAGAGKTHVAVTLGLKALMEGAVRKMIIVRPAVEAGEKLGFLPGLIKDKMDPYVRPVKDIVSKHLGPYAFNKLISEDKLEISPLCYMRGMTLENCFVVFDEAQNATREQMEMFLTRLGFDSKFVVCGDPSQNDLNNQIVAVMEAADMLKGEPDVGIVYFDEADTQRHPLVRTVIERYRKIG